MENKEEEAEEEEEELVGVIMMTLTPVVVAKEVREEGERDGEGMVVIERDGPEEVTREGGIGIEEEEEREGVEGAVNGTTMDEQGEAGMIEVVAMTKGRLGR
jgi:hypothetical protein